MEIKIGESPVGEVYFFVKFDDEIQADSERIVEIY